MYMYLIVRLSVILFTGVVQSMQTSEPSCSRFDYEERLLAKTIRFEMAMDGIVKNVSDAQTTMEAFRSEISEIKARLDALEAKISDTDVQMAVQSRVCPSTYKYNAQLKLCWNLKKSDKRNWFDAQEVCEKDGGHLMIFNVANVFNVEHAVRFMQEWLTTVDGNEVFIGASDMMEEGVFRWTDGEVANTTEWYPGQPGGRRNENCLMMWKNYGYKFGDRACGIKLEYLCQITLKK